VPGGQVKQDVDPPGEYVPFKQDVGRESASRQKAPGGQDKQTDQPDKEYVPLGQVKAEDE
jgi:hypothetical protein